jgi:hypothetical protein
MGLGLGGWSGEKYGWFVGRLELGVSCGRSRVECRCPWGMCFPHR